MIDIDKVIELVIEVRESIDGGDDKLAISTLNQLADILGFDLEQTIDTRNEAYNKLIKTLQ